MKKLIFATLFMALVFSGCKNEIPDYDALLIGKWINTQVDGAAVLTDKSYVCEYRDDLIEFYAIGIQLDENNKTWTENSNYTYRVEGNLIIIDGTDLSDKDFHMEFEILSISSGSFTHSVNKFTIDNVEYPDDKIYTLQKVTADYKSQFIGVWHGRCTTPGSSDTDYHYWEYFADGSFNYYYQDEQENWIRKTDNEGAYFLYGNLMATNYTNDLILGGVGKAYECWKIRISGNNMIWTGLRENNITVTYEMAKVASAPIVN